MARRGGPTSAPVTTRMLAAFDEAAKIVSWRSRQLRGRVLSWHAAAQLKVWDIGVSLDMMRERGAGIDSYTRRVHALHRKLGVPPDYPQRGVTFYREAPDLVAVPCGLNGEHRRMTQATHAQLRAMQEAAAEAGVTLRIRCAFRSIDEQARLIRRLLSTGVAIDEALSMIAAPGYSEHHTGRALDIEALPPGMDFGKTSAFDWLCRNAADFGFEMSYPPGNPHGIVYEPWHWCCHFGKPPPA